MAGLTTHVLDTSIGKPAYKILIELYSIDKNCKKKISECFTNKDGRLDNPLISSENFVKGKYEIVFHLKEYFLKNNLVTPDYNFYENIAIQFSIDEDSHYHIPVLLSPFGYSTYRGS